MSIRPVTVGQQALPPPSGERQVTDQSTPPPALVPAEAVVVAEGRSSATVAAISGTKTADNRSTAIAGEQGQSKVDVKRLREAVEQAQLAIEPQVRDISFSVHEKTGDVVVRIIDRESKEVIRQIPAEEMLRIAERLQETDGEHRPGLLLKQEV